MNSADLRPVFKTLEDLKALYGGRNCKFVIQTEKFVAIEVKGTEIKLKAYLREDGMWAVYSDYEKGYVGENTTEEEVLNQEKAVLKYFFDKKVEEIVLNKEQVERIKMIIEEPIELKIPNEIEEFDKACDEAPKED